MRTFIFLAVLLLITVMIMVKPSYGKWIWNKDTGWIKSPSAEISTEEQRYKYALSLMVEQKYLMAIKEFQLIIDSNPGSKLAEISQMNIGWAYYLNGDYKRALKVYEKVLYSFPGTKRTQEILDKEYQIGLALMETNENAAIKVFEKIIAKNPLGPLAPDAQIKIAACYLKLERFEEAIDTYEKFLEDYPRSEWIPYVQYQIPLAKMEYELMQERNYGLLISARKGFEEYLISNPNGANAEDARRKIEEIRNIEAEREFNIAEFYLRRKKPSAAAIYFDYVIKDYPESIWAERAKERIEFLKIIEAIK